MESTIPDGLEFNLDFSNSLEGFEFLSTESETLFEGEAITLSASRESGGITGFYWGEVNGDPVRFAEELFPISQGQDRQGYDPTSTKISVFGGYWEETDEPIYYTMYGDFPNSPLISDFVDSSITYSNRETLIFTYSAYRLAEEKWATDIEDVSVERIEYRSPDFELALDFEATKEIKYGLIGSGFNTFYLGIEYSGLEQFPLNILGTNFDDSFDGGKTNDSLSGLDGDDIIQGRSGADLIEGGANDDNLFGDDLTNSNESNDGSDTIAGGPGEDLLYGGAGNDYLWSDELASNDLGDEVDVLSGGEGTDYIYGGNGDVVKIDYASQSSLVVINEDGRPEYSVELNWYDSDGLRGDIEFVEGATEVEFSNRTWTVDELRSKVASKEYLARLDGQITHYQRTSSNLAELISDTNDALVLVELYASRAISYEVWRGALEIVNVLIGNKIPIYGLLAGLTKKDVYNSKIDDEDALALGSAFAGLTKQALDRKQADITKELAEVFADTFHSFYGSPLPGAGIDLEIQKLAFESGAKIMFFVGLTLDAIAVAATTGDVINGIRNIKQEITSLKTELETFQKIRSEKLDLLREYNQLKQEELQKKLEMPQINFIETRPGKAEEKYTQIVQADIQKFASLELEAGISSAVAHLAQFSNDIDVDLDQNVDAIVKGTLEFLNGVKVANFNLGDKIVVENSSFSANSLVVTYGSAVLEIDPDLDGEIDATIILTGDFEEVDFLVTSVGNNTEISISSEGMNLAPVAIDDTFSFTENSELAVLDSLSNDSDPEDEALSIVSIDTTTLKGIAVLKNDGTITYEQSGAFEMLNDGESATDTLTYTVSDGVNESTASVAITIDGVSDLNDVSGSNGRDNLVGTVSADSIRSGAGSYDRMTGGLGADEFIFGEETLNGRRERDVIMDYEVGVDSIVLEAGTRVDAIRMTASQVVVVLDGDRDAIYVRGEGVTADNLTIVSEDMFDLI